MVLFGAQNPYSGQNQKRITKQIVCVLIRTVYIMFFMGYLTELLTEIRKKYRILTVGTHSASINFNNTPTIFDVHREWIHFKE